MKLNIGCGNDIKEGYLNIDIRNLSGVDKVSKIEDLTGFENIEEILALDILEHFSIIQVPTILKTWYSFLGIGGTLILKVPNIKSLSESYLNSKISVDYFVARLYGRQNYEYNYHKSGFDIDSITRSLQSIGFKDIKILSTKKHNITMEARKL